MAACKHRQNTVAIRSPRRWIKLETAGRFWCCVSVSSGRGVSRTSSAIPARRRRSCRIGKLVDHGILERRRYSDRPPREEYRLTEKGRDLYGVTVALMRWGDRWIADQPPLALTHTADGGAVEQILRCARCEDQLTAADITYIHSGAVADQRTDAQKVACP